MKRELDKGFIESVESLRGRCGGDVLDGLVQSLQDDDPATAIRVNPGKGVELGEGARRVAWNNHGAMIDGPRPRFTFDPAMHQGLYYVQDPSSMIMETVVGELTAAGNPVVYVDTCAAPGGKTTAAISALPKGSVVIANEYDRRRAEVLVENIIKWGFPDVIVTNNDVGRLAGIGCIADIVTADVPCSGEGMMRKEAVAVEQWSPTLVEQCATLQRSIIDNAWRMLKPGGYFIYSTCTFNRAENEDNLAYIIGELGGIPVDLHLADRFQGIAPAIDSPYPAARFIPGRIEGEGLFMAVVRRPGNDDAEAAPRKEQRQRKDKNGTRPEPASEAAARWINGSGYEIMTEGDRLVAFPSNRMPLLRDVRRVAHVLYAGVELATVKGRDAIPSQALALNNILDISAFNCVAVDYATALQYLSRQAITLADAPRGIVLLTYRGHPLGFVKNLGNRANNLYPPAWAIRSTHPGSTEVDILSSLTQPE